MYNDKDKQDKEEVDYHTYRKEGRKHRLTNKQRDKDKEFGRDKLGKEYDEEDYEATDE